MDLQAAGAFSNRLVHKPTALRPTRPDQTRNGMALASDSDPRWSVAGGNQAVLTANSNSGMSRVRMAVRPWKNKARKTEIRF
jgi:hypothetical protein